MKTILVGATLIDGTGRPPLPNATVVVDGEHIAEVVSGTSQLAVYEEAIRVDLRGKTILPGMVNAHEQLYMKRGVGPVSNPFPPVQVQMLRAMRSAVENLRAGVTTIRDVGSVDQLNIFMRRGIAAKTIVGPRMQACGTSICATGGHVYWSAREADGAEQVRAAAREQIRMGADLIKVFASTEELDHFPTDERAVPTYTLEELQAAAEVAHCYGLKLAVHANGSIGIDRALEAGADTIEHGIYLQPKQAEYMAENGVYLCPTLSGYRQNCDPQRWRRGEWWVNIYTRLYYALRESFKNALAARVKVAVGTDTLGEMVEELELMVESGMKPMEVIVAASRTGAELMGWQAQIGTVEEGKLADMFVVSGDPLKNISVLRNVEYVMKGGIIFEAKELAKMCPPEY